MVDVKNECLGLDLSEGGLSFPQKINIPGRFAIGDRGV
jgi:hypothetical protein